MSDTAKTTVAAKWLLTPTKTELGSKDHHAWTVTNDYREPVYLYVPPGVFVEDSPSEGFHIPGNGGTHVLQLRAEPLRAHGKKSYVVSLKKRNRVDSTFRRSTPR